MVEVSIYMNKETKIQDFHSAALLLHLTIFAYQKSYVDMVGSGSKAILTLTIPYLSELLKNTGLPQLSKEKNIDENMFSYISFVKKGGYIGDVIMTPEGDNAYNFEVKDCGSAYCNHKLFKENHICPFAILAAAVVYYTTGSQISISDSQFNDSGSKTLLTLH
jgi:hypothetical protein